MNYKVLVGAGRSLLLSCFLLTVVTGCRNMLVFSTATKFGLDISESAAQQPEITFGYNRVEVVSIPLGAGDTNTPSHHRVRDAGATNDAYSVLGSFVVSFDPKLFNASSNSGIHVNEIFATGVAAQQISASPVMGAIFANDLNRIISAKTNGATISK